MSAAKPERSLSDIRTLNEALSRALYDSGKHAATVAEQMGLARVSYLTEALNAEHDLQFQARLLLAFCRATSSLPVAWLADQLGFVLVKREQATGSRDIALEALDVADAAGALSRSVRDAYADGRLSEQERADIRELAHRVQREAAEVERAVSMSPISLADRRTA